MLLSLLLRIAIRLPIHQAPLTPLNTGPHLPLLENALLHLNLINLRPSLRLASKGVHLVAGDFVAGEVLHVRLVLASDGGEDVGHYL